MACIRKVGVLGQGHVGAHVANSLLVQGLVDELYLCDINAQKLTSETQDFTDALSFYPHNCKIVNCRLRRHRERCRRRCERRQGP